VSKKVSNKIEAKGFEVSIVTQGTDDYISLTDIAKYKNINAPADVVKNWLRVKDTIEFLGLWEQLNNRNFKLVEFDQFKDEAGTNAFTLSPKQWIEKTNAIGLKSSAGRYGGTFAHVDIALEFASWVSSEFKLYVIKEYQRLKQSESYRNQIEWNVNRELAKVNYVIHTDAIKAHLMPVGLTKQQIGRTYANEADVLNVALFGLTAREFKLKNPDKKGNQRDHATIEQNIIMANLENSNALLIRQGIQQSERLQVLRELAVEQLESIINSRATLRIKKLASGGAEDE